MTFDGTKFAMTSSHANSNVPRTFAYKSTDTQATINTSGYFNTVARELHVGDYIYAFTDTGGTPTPVHLWVISNDGTTVDVANGDALTVTNSD